MGSALAAWSRTDRSLVVLLVTGACLFTAGMSTLSLGSLDDAFYARKGVEMARSGRFFTVTWADAPTFQNPPLQIWLVAQSHRLFGEGDVAARFPSVVMALATLVITHRIGRRLVGREAALTAIALLLMTPLFVEGARGCMMEMPQTFWTALAMLIILESRDRPRRLVWLALPLAAGILTKSLLGLFPVIVLAGAALTPGHREVWYRRELWTALGLGMVLGSSWTVHQGLTIGVDAIRAHYVGEIAVRSTAGFDVGRFLTEYFIILVRDFHLVLIPGVIGMVMMSGRGHRTRFPAHLLLVAWVVVPVVLFNLSSARSARYVYPILPALALCGGWWLTQTVPRVARHLVSGIVPLGALVVALILVVAPDLLTRDRNGPFKRAAPKLTQRISADEAVPYLGDRYWEIANPLLYYADRRLAPSAGSARQASAAASTSPDRLLMVDRDRMAELEAIGLAGVPVLAGPQWVLLDVR